MPRIQRLLVVDDDVDFADSLADLLSSEGFDVAVAYDGDRALELARDGAFDVTLLDVQMPGKDGVLSLEALRRLDPEARVVMMTGYSTPARLDSALAAGAVAVLDKPLDLERLRRLIDGAEAVPVALVADDDLDFADSLRSVLESSGYAVMRAATGEQLLERVQARRPDVLLLDLRMPDMGGAQAYLELSRRGIRLPTIVISAYLDEERGALAKLPGLAAECILAKPVDAGRLISLVARVSTGG